MHVGHTDRGKKKGIICLSKNEAWMLAYQTCYYSSDPYPVPYLQHMQTILESISKPGRVQAQNPGYCSEL
jgi:hypothetical protein